MLSILALALALQAAPADSVAGTWKITGDVSGNPLESTCTLTLTGSTIGGNCTGSTGEKMPVTGEVKDGKITFKHGGDYQGTALTIIYSGTLAEKQLKGTVDVQPFGVGGTFTAAPAPATPAKP
jgi:hypothetical protein